MDREKNQKLKRVKFSAAYSDADSALQHAVVRGESKEELDRLRKIRDDLKPID